MHLNAADLINGGYVTVKNELTHFLRQASTQRKKILEQKLKTSDSLRVEEEIMRRLLATVKVKQAELYEGNLKVVERHCAENTKSKNNIMREIQSEDGKILTAQDDIMKEVKNFDSTLYKNDICNGKANEDVLKTSLKTITEEEPEELTELVSKDEITKAIECLNL